MPPGGAAAWRRAGAVDDLADHHGIATGAIVHGAHHDVAGVDPHPHVECDAVAAFELLVEVAQPVVHGERRSHGPWGSSSRARCMPNTAITASPMNFSTMPPSCSMQRAHMAKYSAMTVRTSSESSSLREHGEVDQIGEQDGHLFALLDPAADTSGSRRSRSGGQGGVDDVVAEHGALLLERLDRTVQRDEVVGGCRDVHRR